MCTRTTLWGGCLTHVFAVSLVVAHLEETIQHLVALRQIVQTQSLVWQVGIVGGLIKMQSHTSHCEQLMRCATVTLLWWTACALHRQSRTLPIHSTHLAHGEVDRRSFQRLFQVSGNATVAASLSDQGRGSTYGIVRCKAGSKTAREARQPGMRTEQTLCHCLFCGTNEQRRAPRLPRDDRA